MVPKASCGAALISTGSVLCSLHRLKHGLNWAKPPSSDLQVTAQPHALGLCPQAWQCLAKDPHFHDILVVSHLTSGPFPISFPGGCSLQNCLAPPHHKLTETRT